MTRNPVLCYLFLVMLKNVFHAIVLLLHLLKASINKVSLPSQYMEEDLRTGCVAICILF